MLKETQKQENNSLQDQSIIWSIEKEYGEELYINTWVGCRDGNAVHVGIGKTSRDGMWEKRTSVAAGVGSGDIFTVDYMVWI